MVGANSREARMMLGLTKLSHGESVPLPGRITITNSGSLKRWCFGWMVFSLLVVMALLPKTAQAAGIRHIVIPASDNGSKIVAELWTPCGQSAPPVVVDRSGIPTTMHVIENCAVTRKRLPLIIISHGMFEDRFSHFDTAEFLADAGFAVVAINHSQDSTLDIGGKSADDISAFLIRPVDIKRTIDFLEHHPPAGVDIDLHHIGFFGFSRGGYTGLVLAGGIPDFNTLVIDCPPIAKVCAQIRDHKIPPHASGYEPRISAYVIADPVDFFPDKSSLKDVHAPIQLWSSELGGFGVRPEEVSAVAANLPVRPEFHRVAGATHLSFDCPCSEEAKAAHSTVVCSDPAGFDRVSFHKKFNEDVTDFFRNYFPN
jgi:predicted dienelactone hydrolase